MGYSVLCFRIFTGRVFGLGVDGPEKNCTTRILRVAMVAIVSTLGIVAVAARRTLELSKPP